VNILVAFPSNAPGGLDAALSAHFGHCEAFTLVRLRDGEAEEVCILPAAATHVEGGCLAVVELLARAGVQAVIAGGIGGRPLAGLQQAGIAVYRAPAAASVRVAAAALADGQLAQFGPEFVCGSDHHHAGHESAATGG
jgi:predicted Fe-Mo cluster-binding NifX family protein